MSESVASVRLRFELVVDYDARPADYEGAGGDPEKMAEMDLESIKTGALSPYDFGDPVVETVQVVR